MSIKVREGGAWVQVSDGADGADGATPLYVSHACIVDRKATGTTGGTPQTFPTRSFHYPRDINHILFDPDNIVSLTGGIGTGFTLPNAGSYRIDWSCPFYDVGRFQTALEWTAKGAGTTLPISTSSPNYVNELVEWGTSEFQNNTGNFGQSRSFASARVTTTESTLYTIRYAVKFDIATYGLGVEGDWGNIPSMNAPGTNTAATLYNYYTMVNIYKEG